MNKFMKNLWSFLATWYCSPILASLASSNLGVDGNLMVMAYGRVGFPWWLSRWRILLQCWRHRRCRFDSWVGKIPWRRIWQPTPVFLPGKFHGQRSLVGYSPWGHKDLEITEQQHTEVRKWDSEFSKSNKGLDKLCSLSFGVTIENERYAISLSLASIFPKD